MHLKILAAILVLAAAYASAQVQEQAAVLTILAHDAQAQQASAYTPEPLTGAFAWLANLWREIGHGAPPPEVHPPQQPLVDSRAPPERMAAERAARQP
jgi:hypothetical protein